MPSELQSCFTGGGRHGGDAAVVGEPASVEHDLVDTGGLGALGDQLAHLGRSVDARARVGTQVGLGGRRGGERGARVVVDDLDREVLVGPEHGQTRPSGGAVDLLANPAVATDASVAAGFGDLAHQMLRYFLPALPALRSTRSPA